MSASSNQRKSLSENKRDFADIPSDVLDKPQIIFSDPVNAAFRAMGLG